MKKNVLGQALEPCCHTPMTGYFRDGFCRTDASDQGKHVICAEMTTAFLAFTQQHGNDLSTPRPAFGFLGLKPGDRWCLCASRWQQAWQHGVAPPVILAACEASALQVVPLEVLQQHATTAVDE